MENENFELICEYIHCKGKSTHIAGTVATEAEAAGWVRSMQNAVQRGEKPPREKGFVCKATVCPLKQSIPFYSYRKAAV